MTRVNKIKIEQLMARYSVLLLDAYGVLVHTSGALPGAAQFGLDAVLVDTGITNLKLNAADASLQPTYYLDSLSNQRPPAEPGV